MKWPKKKSFRNTSASQNNTFRSCKRKWFLEKLLDREPEGSAQLRGTIVHYAFLEGRLGGNKNLDKLEAYMDQMCDALHREAEGDPRRDGAWITDRLMTSELLDTYCDVLERSGYFPPQGTPGVIEQFITITTPGDLPPWKGYVDLATEAPGIEGWVRIQDLKTLSSLRWAKTESELLDDVQMMSYAHWAFAELGATNVDVEWNYLECRMPPPKTVPPRIHRTQALDVSREHVESIWEREMDQLRDMVDIWANIDDPADVTPTGAGVACREYGGCPFQEFCGEGAAAVQDHPLVQLGGKNVSDSKKTSGFLQKLIAAKENAEPEETEDEAGTLADDAESRTNDEPEAEAEETEDDEIAAAEAALAAKKKKAAEKKAAEKKAAEKKAAEKKAAEKKAAEKKAAEKKAAADKPKKKSGGAKSRSFTLYVDCTQTKGSAQGSIVDFDDWVAPIVAALNTAHPPDYRTLGFADEKAAFAAALNGVIAESGLPTKMTISSAGSFSRDALSILKPYATTVVRALRG